MDSLKGKVIDIEHLAIEQECEELIREGVLKRVRDKKGIIHFLESSVETPKGFTEVKRAKGSSDA